MTKEPKLVKYKCYICNTVHEINVGKMMVELSLQGLDKNQLKERTRKATEASVKARKKRNALKAERAFSTSKNK